MPSIYIECPSCGWEGKIDEGLVGKRLKCPKCATSFLAEVGGTYDLADPRPTPAEGRAPRRPRASGPARPAPEAGPDEAAPGEEGPKSWLDAWPSE